MVRGARAKRRGAWRSAALLVLLVSACSKAPVPPPPRPPPPPPPPVVIKKESPPKCESLTESCIATDKTRAKIKQGRLIFAPPSGWSYAQETEATEATIQGAAFALTTFTKSDAKSHVERDEAVKMLAGKLGLVLPKRHSLLRAHADQKQKVGDLTVLLFQVGGAKREGKKGPLLIFTADISPSEELAGIGFVADDDKADRDQAILKAIQSIARAEEPKAP